jgi:hypothetical protein
VYTAEYKEACKSYENGVYKVRIPAGTYDVTARYNSDKDYNGAVVNQYKQTFSGATSNYDFTLPLYKVTITGDKDKQIYPRYAYGWSIQKGESVTSYIDGDANESDADYYSRVMYLKAGTYTLESAKDSDDDDNSYKYTDTYVDKDGKTSTEEPENGWFYGYTQTHTYSYTCDTYRLTANVTVGNAAVTVPAAKTIIEAGKTSTSTRKYIHKGLNNAENTKTVSVGVSFDIEGRSSSWSDDVDTYSYPSKCVFTPTEDGNYTIDYSRVKFYTTDGDALTKSNGSYALTKGTTYIVSNGESYGCDDVTIQKVADTDDSASDSTVDEE